MTRRRRSRPAVAGAVLALAGPLVLAACAGQEQSGTPAHQVATWVTGAGAGPAIGSLGADIRNIDAAIGGHQPASAVRTVCALLAHDATAANGNLPTSDQRLTDDLSSAYQDAYAAGSDCYNGASGNRALLDRSAAERSKAAEELTAAVDRIAAVTGRVPSTTTTTAPPGAGSDPFGG